MEGAALTSFSPDGSRFTAVSPGGAVKVWDTSLGAVVADWKESDAQLSVSYSCVACCYVGKKRKKDRRAFLVALGTLSGEILTIDMVSGEKKLANTACHSGKVVALSFENNGRMLYSAGADGVVWELNPETGEQYGTIKASKRPITSLAISHDKQFIGVSSKVTRLFSLNDKTQILKIPSVFGTIEHIALSADGKYAVCSVNSNNELQFLSFDHENGSTMSTAKLSMETEPKMVECGSYSYIEGTIVLSLSKKGVAYVWHLQNLSEDTVSPTKISVREPVQTLDVPRDGKKGRIPIASAKLLDVKEDNTVSVIVAYGSFDSFQFKIVELGETAKSVNLVAENDASHVENMMAKMQENMDQDAKGNGGEIEESDPQEIIISKEKGRTKKRAASDLDSADVARTSEANAVYDLDEPTMEEKLARLNLVNSDNKKDDSEEAMLSVRPPSADSVHVLLKQALHADDHSLLLDCLYNRDEKIIMDRNVGIFTLWETRMK